MAYHTSRRSHVPFNSDRFINIAFYFDTTMSPWLLENGSESISTSIVLFNSRHFTCTASVKVSGLTFLSLMSERFVFVPIFCDCFESSHMSVMLKMCMWLLFWAVNLDCTTCIIRRFDYGLSYVITNKLFPFRDVIVILQI